MLWSEVEVSDIKFCYHSFSEECSIVKMSWDDMKYSIMYIYFQLFCSSMAKKEFIGVPEENSVQTEVLICFLSYYLFQTFLLP